MKIQKLFTLFALFLFSISVYTQGFDGGLLIGIAPTQIDGDNYWGFNKVGIVGGAFVTREFKQGIGGKAALRYIEKGSQKGDNDEPLPYYKARLHYVEMPVTATYNYKKKLELEAGISLGYLIKAKEAYISNYMNEPVYVYEPFEIGALAGVSYHFHKLFAVNAQFMYSLLPVKKYNTKNQTAFSGQYNQVVILTLIYKMSPK